MALAKISWVQDNFSGPINGMIEYQGEELWFSVANDPLFKSSTDVAVPKVESSNEERTFNLLRLSPEVMKEVNDNHIEYCNKTGAPLFHGDPWKKKPVTQAVKATSEELKEALPEGKTTFEVQPRQMSRVVQHIHSAPILNITGEYVATIKQSDISNYNVAQSFVYEN